MLGAMQLNNMKLRSVTMPALINMKLPRVWCGVVPSRGVATGYLYPLKSAQVNFLWSKNDVRTAIQQFYTPPQKKHTPKQISGYAPGALYALDIV